MGKLQPKLRFPEFICDWNQFLGNELFNSVTNKNHNSDLPVLAISQEYGAIPRHLIDYKVSVTEKSLESYKIVEEGDFIISLRSFQGGIEYSTYKGICSPAYIILKPIVEIERLFYKYYFKTDKYIIELNKKLEGIRDGKMVSFKYFSEIEIPFPTLPEQTKIASFLTTVDKKIAGLKKQLFLLERYKKGVIQKIFAQELRFKDENGRDFIVWGYPKGNELFNSVTNKNHNSDLPVLAISQEYGAIPRHLIDYKVSVTEKSLESYKIVEEGDFIISLRSFQGGIEYSTYKGICSPAYIILKPIVEIERLFYKYYFKTDKYIIELNKKLEGIRDGKMVSFKYFSEIEIPLPSLPEQQKIASFLSTIDEKIEKCQCQIKAMDKWKKGLLQQMFC